MSATLEQIASRAGVSKVTVADVLSGRHRPTRRAAAARAERVRQIARELGYRPNTAARAIRAGRFGCVALLLSTKSGRSHLPPELLQGVHDALAEQEQRLELTYLSDEMLTSEAQMPRLLRELSADGLLIDYTGNIPADMIQIIDEYQLPVVWLNSKQPADCVHPDDEEAGYRATRHLLDAGHTRIAYVDYSHGPDFPSPHYSAADRRAGYERAMAEAGLSPRIETASRDKEVVGPRRVGQARAMLKRDDRPTAVLTYGQTEALPLLQAAAALGLTVPDDLSLVNFGDRAIGYMGPRLTTVLVPHEQTGREAVAMLKQKIAQPDEALPPRTVPFGFEPGQTVARAAG